MKYCAKCIILGGPWFVVCVKTERYKSLYVVVTRDEYSLQEWERKKTMIENALEDIILIPFVSVRLALRYPLDCFSIDWLTYLHGSLELRIHPLDSSGLRQARRRAERRGRALQHR